MNPFVLFAAGLCFGILSRLLDIYTQNLGNVFSEMAIWILLGVIISIYSETRTKAMRNIFPFCVGMLITYYAAAVIANGVYSRVFVIGWTIFALLTPIFAYFAWMTKEPGLFPKIISIGIVLGSVLSSVLLFDRLRWYDFAIDAILIYFLFFKNIVR